MIKNSLLLGWFLCAILSFSVWCEDITGTYARIISQGHGEVTTTPTHVDFEFTRLAQDSSFDLAFKCIQDFETKLRLKFTEESPRPVEIQVISPLYRLEKEPQIEVQARVSFSLAGIVAVENGPQLFAKLWDKMRAMANEFSAELKGPYLRVQNEEMVIRSAINSAIENAYPYADACAASLKGGIYAVDKIEVNKVDWDYAGKKEGDAISLSEIRCKASVTVTYLVGQL